MLQKRSYIYEVMTAIVVPPHVVKGLGGDIEGPMKIPRDEAQQKSEKFKTKISDEAERKRREKALDDAIENTFPASDPVSAEQPV